MALYPSSRYSSRWARRCMLWRQWRPGDVWRMRTQGPSRTRGLGPWWLFRRRACCQHSRVWVQGLDKIPHRVLEDRKQVTADNAHADFCHVKFLLLNTWWDDVNTLKLECFTYRINYLLHLNALSIFHWDKLYKMCRILVESNTKHFLSKLR